MEGRKTQRRKALNMAQARVQAVIEGNELVIRLPLNPNPVLSATGKTLVVASSHGNQETAALVNGQPVIIGVNAYIRRERR
jgi:hypothetical protein